MYERSITIGSVGKTFSVTGWKCGWAISGNPNIMTALRKAHSTCLYVGATIIQEAAARAFEIELDKLVNNRASDLYWTKLSDMMLTKRNKMVTLLSSLGLKPITPEGSYFMIADCTQLMNSVDLTEFYDKRGKSFAFVKFLSKNGLQALPLSVFFCEEYKHLGEGLLRFCFIKSDETLAKAEQVLKELKERMSSE